MNGGGGGLDLGQVAKWGGIAFLVWAFAAGAQNSGADGPLTNAGRNVTGGFAGVADRVQGVVGTTPEMAARDAQPPIAVKCSGQDPTVVDGFDPAVAGRNVVCIEP
jgi:hypothetical protein